MAEIKLPAIGPVDAKWVYAGGALVVGIAGYAYLNRSTATTLPADDLDQSADWSGEGVDAGGPWTSSPPGGSSVITTPQDPADLPPTTNDDWTRRAVNGLSGIGWEPQLVATVLGKYLGRQQVTPAEAVIITAAKAYQGDPPQGTYSILLLPAGTAPPAKPTVKMAWVSTNVQTRQNNWTLSMVQREYLQLAGRMPGGKPYNAAQVSSIVGQAGIRSRITPAKRLRSGTWITVFKAV